jgi:hypothetical protein
MGHDAQKGTSHPAHVLACGILRLALEVVQPKSGLPQLARWPITGDEGVAAKPELPFPRDRRSEVAGVRLLRHRCVELLSYIVALVYHVRGADEQPELRDVVDRSVQTDPHRKELTKMGQTIAEMYMEKGREKGRIEGKMPGEIERARTILLRLLRKRFKRVPRKVEARIAATVNMRDLETWLDNILNAETLVEVGISLD